MKIHRYPGYYLALEGLDGSGSDLVAKGLVRQLKEQALAVVFIKEPGQSEIGQVIKKLLLNKTES